MCNVKDGIRIYYHCYVFVDRNFFYLINTCGEKITIRNIVDITEIHNEERGPRKFNTHRTY